MKARVYPRAFFMRWDQIAQTCATNPFAPRAAAVTFAAMSADGFPKIGHFKDVAGFTRHLQTIGADLPIDEQVLSAAQGSPLAQALDIGGGAIGGGAGGGFIVGNRWCIHPMEGWDGTTTGEPSEHTIRRWAHFGQSGAKFIWGGEAFAVQSDGRANPRQIGVIDDDVGRAEKGAATLLETLVRHHKEKFGDTDDLLVGLQLTHSGRFCRPVDKSLRPRIAYHHPILDAKFGIAPDDDSVVLSDGDIRRIIANYVRAAKLAQRVGYRFVDVKACHGYLGHECSARSRARVRTAGASRTARDTCARSSKALRRNVRD